MSLIGFGEGWPRNRGEKKMFYCLWTWGKRYENGKAKK